MVSAADAWGPDRGNWPSSPRGSGTTTSGSTTTSRRSRGPCRRTCSRRSPCWPRWPPRRPGSGWASSLTCAADPRNVGLLAKEAACVDVYSGGRLVLGLGAGWYDREYQAYGYRYPPARERLAILDESLEVIRRLWTEDTVTFDGEHVHLDGLYRDPKPIQQLPRLLVGGGGEQVTLRIAARHADADELAGRTRGLRAQVRPARAVLRRRSCRPFEAITRTHGPDCRIFDTEADLWAWCDQPGGGHRRGSTDPETYVRDNLVGTVEQVTEKAQGYVDAGCQELILGRDYPYYTTLRRFIAEVAPQLPA